MCMSAYMFVCLKLNLTSSTNRKINLTAQHVTRTYHLFPIALDDDEDDDDDMEKKEIKRREFKP